MSFKLTKGEIKEVNRRHRKQINDGKKLTVYQCNHCEGFVPTLRPDKKDVSKKGFWDSVMICIVCFKMNFVRVYPNGKTESIKFPTMVDKKEPKILTVYAI